MAGPRIRTVIINTDDRDRLAEFWSAFLGVEVLEVDEQTAITWLKADTEGGVNLGFQYVDGIVDAPTRTHLDVSVGDLEVARGVIDELGGGFEKRNRLSNGFEWWVMTDPDGNEFCIYVD